MFYLGSQKLGMAAFQEGSSVPTVEVNAINRTGSDLAKGSKAFYHFVETEIGASKLGRPSYLSQAVLNAVGKDGLSYGVTTNSTTYNLSHITNTSDLTSETIEDVTIQSGTMSRYSSWGIMYSSSGNTIVSNYATNSGQQKVICIDSTNHWSKGTSDLGDYCKMIGFDIAYGNNLNDSGTTQVHLINENNGSVLKSINVDFDMNSTSTFGKRIALNNNQIISDGSSSTAPYIYNLDWNNNSYEKVQTTLSNDKTSMTSYNPRWATADNNIVCFATTNNQLINGSCAYTLFTLNKSNNTLTAIDPATLPGYMATAFAGGSNLSYHYITFNHHNGLLTIVDGNGFNYYLFKYNTSSKTWTEIPHPFEYEDGKYPIGPMTFSDDMLLCGYHYTTYNYPSQGYRYPYFMLVKLNEVNANSIENISASIFDNTWKQGITSEVINSGATGKVKVFA